MARRAVSGGTIVLDSQGLSKAAEGEARARAALEVALRRQARVLVSAVTLTEVLRGGQRDTKVRRALRGMIVQDVTRPIARAAGELLGATGMSATIDAIVVSTALAQQGPVLILTSDPRDLGRLTETRSDVVISPI